MAIDSNVPIVTNQVSADLTAMANNMKLIVCGDGTAGRVLRLSKLTISGNATAVITVKMETVWNGNDIAEETNLGNGGDTGNFSLDAFGKILTIDKAGFTTNIISVLNTTIYSNKISDSYVLNAYGNVSSSNMIIGCLRNGTGAEYALTDLDSGDSIIIYTTYLTSA